MEHIKAFAAGFFSTLIFHQGVYTFFYLGDSSLAAPFNMAATDPIGIPAVISLALWGGVWGVGIWWTIRAVVGKKHWGLAALFGALGPSMIAMLIVFPMKDLPVDAKTWVGALILNAAWGLGLALIMRFIHRRDSTLT